MPSAVGTTYNFHSGFKNVFMKTFMYGVVGSLAMFISSWEKADRLKDQFIDKSRDYGDTFDFIVVGGGTGGSVVANRLSSQYKVLLLEAGGDPHPFHSIPLMANFMSNYDQVDWMHKTVRQRHACFGSVGNQAGISQGKSLGGTSNLDYMMYLRGSPQDYDNWANTIGDQSWSYNSMMGYFKKHETYEGPWKDINYHGTSGELNLAVPTYTGIGASFCNAGKEMGYQYMDLNSPFSEGFDMSLYPTKRGYRHAVFKAFLQTTSKNRWNLEVQKYSHVNRVLIRGPNYEAYGVEYDRHGKRRTAFAKKEVILSAGSIQSPKILMLSGIGPAHDLAALGVPAKVNLPDVGKNLQDHLAVQVGPFYTDSQATLLLDRDLTGPAIMRYALSTGPLTTTGFEASALLTSDTGKLTGRANWPDTLLIMNGLAHHESSAEDFAHAHRFRRELMKNYWSQSKGVDSFSVIVSASRPKSRGYVKLQSSNPYVPPLIDPNYLEQVEDVGVMVDGIKKVMRMVENTLTFEKVGAKFTNQSVPGCTQYRFKSDDYWSCYVRLMSFSMGDVAGTLGMGRVVDQNLNVYGVQRLRVIDASVMPDIVSAGTSAATLAIGEKGADMILKLWGASDKIKSVSTEGKKVQSILQESASKLRDVQQANTLWNAIKHTDSFRNLGPVPAETARNPLKLIGALLKNSVKSTGESDNNNVTPQPYSSSADSVYFTTSQPLTSTSPPTRPTPSTTKRPRMESLFQESSSYVSYPVHEVVQITPESHSHSGNQQEKNVKPTPYVLSPHAFLNPPLKPTDIEKNIKSSNFFIPRSTTKKPKSFSSAVDSIISQTLPILSRFSNPKNPDSPVPYSFLNRRETNQKITSTTSAPIKHYTTSRPSSFPTTPTGIVPKVVQTVPQPIRSVLEPFSKIVNKPFEGIFKRIRSILKPVTVATTRRPILTQEELLGITFPTIPKVEYNTTTPPADLATPLKTVERSNSSTPFSITAPLPSSTLAVPFNPYLLKQTNFNNTFKYSTKPLILVVPNASTSERPPIDYELMEDPDTLDRPTKVTENVSKNTNASNSLKKEPTKDIKVIYQRPTTSPKESISLAQNVQELLKSFETQSPGVTQTNNQPVAEYQPHYSSAYYLDDSTKDNSNYKTLRDEVHKLISTSKTQNNHNSSNQAYLLIASSSPAQNVSDLGQTNVHGGDDSNTHETSFRGTVLVNQNPSFSSSVKDLLQDNTQEGQASKDAISSTNLLDTIPPSLSSSILSNSTFIKGESALIWPPLPPDSSPRYKTNNYNDNLSFRIKILNQ